jgi:hypothetical protein
MKKMIQRLVFIFLLLGFNIQTHAQQSFEGRLKYVISTQIKDPEKNDVSEKKAFEMYYNLFCKDNLIKGNADIQIGGMQMTMTIFYDLPEKRIYLQMPKYIKTNGNDSVALPMSDTLFWMEMPGTNLDSTTIAEIARNTTYSKLPNTVNILGEECSGVEVKTSEMNIKIYISSKYKMDLSNFTMQFTGYSSKITKPIEGINTGGMLLLMIVETPKMNMEMRATEVQPMELEKAFFDLPKGMPIAKMPK